MRLKNLFGTRDMQREGAQTQGVSHSFGADANNETLRKVADELKFSK